MSELENTSENAYFPQMVDVLNYLWNKHSQKLVDNEVTWKFMKDRGHIEFYMFGPILAAVPVYTYIKDTIGDRLELLTISHLMSKETIDLAVTEMINMIKRKRIGPVTRRIKFTDD